MKIPKFGTKNALIGYFWLKMLFFGIFGLEFEKTYCHIWNKRPWVCLVERLSAKLKILKFGTQNAWFALHKKWSFPLGISPEMWPNPQFPADLVSIFYLASGLFGVEFEKNIVIFEISTLKFVKNESLTHTVNFGIGSDLPKGLGSAFSVGPGPGPLYKACRLEARTS